MLDSRKMVNFRYNWPYLARNQFVLGANRPFELTFNQFDFAWTKPVRRTRPSRPVRGGLVWGWIETFWPIFTNVSFFSNKKGFGLKISEWLTAWFKLVIKLDSSIDAVFVNPLTMTFWNVSLAPLGDRCCVAFQFSGFCAHRRLKQGVITL